MHILNLNNKVNILQVNRFVERVMTKRLLEAEVKIERRFYLFNIKTVIFLKVHKS